MGRGAQEAAQAGAEALEQGGRGVARGMHRAGQAGADLARQGAAAGADSLQHLGAAAGETMRRGGQAAAEGQRGLAHHAAEQLEEASTRLAATLQESARDLRALFAVPGFSQAGMQEARESVSGLVEGVMRTNLRAVQEIFRMASPLNTIELQRRLSAEYLETMLHSTAALLRAARRSAEETLRPLEDHIADRSERRQADEQAQRHEPQHGRVADVMATDVRIASPEDTVQRAAQLMREADAGALPVGEGDRLVGVVTDRDVAIRLVAEGRDPRQTRVREVMTPEVRYVFEDEDLDHVAENMAQQQLHRLPVVNREKRLVGVISLADLARKGRAPLAARIHAGIAREGGQHQQAAE